VVAVAAAVSMTGLITPAGAQSGKVPGVTAKEIKVGAVVGKTNPTGAPYDQVAEGAEMYFDYVNKKGGIFGKKYKMVAVLDDQTRDSKNLINTRSLVEEKDVFAVIMATQTFAGAQYLVDKGVPTFGWTIQSEWALGPNLFGDKGSWLCFGAGCVNWAPVFVAQKEGAKAAASLAYGSSPQSADCSKAIEATFGRYGPQSVLNDRSLSFGFSANDISAGVKEIKDDGFTFVIDFLPFENAKESKEMQLFMKEMKKRGIEPGEHSLVGWNSAQLLVEGLKKVGKNVTQKGVVDAINSITDWTYNGMRPSVNWTTAHGPAPAGSKTCAAYVEVKNGKFVPVYNQPGKPYVCFPENPYPATLVPEYSAK